jgi:hypothetical protein
MGSGRSSTADPALIYPMEMDPFYLAPLGADAASFAAIQAIVERGQADGSIRADLDARLASYVFYGAVDELLTGWVLGRLPDSEEDVARAEQTLVQIVTGGLAPELATAET